MKVFVVSALLLVVTVMGTLIPHEFKSPISDINDDHLKTILTDMRDGYLNGTYQEPGVDMTRTGCGCGTSCSSQTCGCITATVACATYQLCKVTLAGVNFVCLCSDLTGAVLALLTKLLLVTQCVVCGTA